MTSTTHTDEKPSGGSHVRPRYITLGQDRIADTHLYRTVDETIFVIDIGGHIVKRYDLGDRPLELYREFIDEQRGWLDYRPRVKADITDPFAMLEAR